MVHRILQIIKPWTLRSGAEFKHPNGIPLVIILKENEQLDDPEWTGDEQLTLNMLVERTSSPSSAKPWSIYRWKRGCFSVVLEDTKGHKSISGEWSDEWPLKTCVEPLMSQWLKLTFPWMVGNYTSRVSRTRRKWQIKKGSPCWTNGNWKCTPQCAFSTNSSAILFSSWPSSSFEVVVNQVFHRSCWYIPHVCRNGPCWKHRNAFEILEVMKSHCICQNTQSGWDRPQSYSGKPPSNNWGFLGIKWVVAGICLSWPARANRAPHTSLVSAEPSGYQNNMNYVHLYSGLA